MVEALIDEADTATTIRLNNFQELKEEIDREISEIKNEILINITKNYGKYNFTILKS